MPLPADYVSTDAVVTRGGARRRLSRIYRQKWGIGNPAPATSATNNIKTAAAGPNNTTITYSTTQAPLFDGTLFVGNRVVMDHPRNVVITVTHASAVVAESGVITGLDLQGNLITEAWSVTAGGTSKVFTGKKAFAAVLSVTVTAAGDASANTNVIGNGNVLGLEVNSALGATGAAVKELVDGAVLATGVMVAASGASTDDSRGTYAPVTAPNGAHTYDVSYITDDPENS